MITFYHAPRSRSFRILWLLEEIGAPYEMKLVTIRRGDGSGASDPNNPHPHGKVPAITHDGATVFETTAIALYLTDAFPQSGLGIKAGEAGRGAYLTWLAYYSGVVEPSFTAKFLNIQHIYGTFGWAPFDEVIPYLMGALETSPYFMGERFSAVDVIFGGSFPILMTRGMIPETPALKEYVARVTARSGFARAQAKDGG